MFCLEHLFFQVVVRCARRRTMTAAEGFRDSGRACGMRSGFLIFGGDDEEDDIRLDEPAVCEAVRRLPLRRHGGEKEK